MEIDINAQDTEEVVLLRARTAELEQRLAEQERTAAQEVLYSDLRLAALRSGMIDLDGIKLIDPKALKPAEAGAKLEFDRIMSDLRRDKPWLFGSGTSSSVATPPASSPPRRKLATEMTMEEWRSARSELLRRR